MAELGECCDDWQLVRSARERKIAHLRALLAREPGSVSLRSALASALVELHCAHIECDDAAAAAAPAYESAAILRRLHEERPRDQRRATDLAEAYVGIARMASTLSSDEEARQSYLAALDVLASTRGDADDRHGVDLELTCLEHLSALHERRGELEDARRFGRAHLSLARRLARRYADVPLVYRIVADAALLLAELELRAGALDAAYTLCTEALRVARRALSFAPWAHALRPLVVAALQHMGEIGARRGETDRSRALIDRALTHSRSTPADMLSVVRPFDTSSWFLLAARREEERGDRRRAVALLREALRGLEAHLDRQAAQGHQPEERVTRDAAACREAIARLMPAVLND